MSRYRDSPQNSTTDLTDYYGSIPPPHHISDVNYSTQDIPLVTAADSSTRGAYAPAEDFDPTFPPYDPYSAMPSAQDQSNLDSYNWSEKEALAARKKRSRWIVIGSVLSLLGLIIIGVVVGVVVSKNKKASSASGGSSSDPQVVKETNPNDPSTFTKDSRLKPALYGLAYTPENSLLPDCGNQLADVITDIQLISQLTKRIRLYGADCNQSALVLEAIKQTKVDVNVYLGIYPEPDDNNTAYNRQRGEIQDVLTTYGTDHVSGLTVGNEFMLNYLNAHQATDPNGAVGNTGAAQLLADIQDARSMLSSLNLSIPVGNSDAGSFFNTQVLQAVDYGLSNVHPWFANVSIDVAAAWTAQFFEQTNVQPASQLSNHPNMYIAETGWPTKSSDAANANNGASAASEANLQV
jgi:exo-beta-1,3-glucanase (GH17 family)